MRKRLTSGLLTLTIVGAAALGAGPAGADPASGGDASAFGGTLTLAGQEVLPPTPLAEVTGTGDDTPDVAESVLELPASPLAFNQTLNAEAHVHQDADLTSSLDTHTVEGPYNAQALGQVENLEVLIDAVAPSVPLVSADLITGEVVAKCVGDAVEYSAVGDTVDLVVADQTALGDAVDDVLAQLFPGLDPLDPLVNIEQNVVTELEDGLAIDALVITVLEAADPAGVVQARFGHAELSGVACGGALTECSDTQDNDGDGKVDVADPGCHTDGNADNPGSYDPTDDSEGDGTQCADSTDNDGDGKVDAADPGCHTDGNADNPGSYDPSDDSEAGAAPLATDVSPSKSLPATGASIATGAAAAMALGGLALYGLRRRLT
jgi:hypothetical protein